ncbi:MAG: flagellar export protein FliJ [Planctomycetota bacterium]
MAKFQFRLATLQTLRETRRDEMRAKLAEAYEAEQLLAKRIESIYEEENKLRELHRTSVQDTVTDVNQLLNVQRYSATLKGQLATLRNQSQMLATEVEKRRQALVEADQQVKLLEKLHDRKLTAHRHSESVAEAKELDEIGSQARGVEL